MDDIEASVSAKVEALSYREQMYIGNSQATITALSKTEIQSLIKEIETWSPIEQLFINIVFTQTRGRKLGPDKDGNRFKRWKGLTGAGVEFRPFDYWDYGYTDDINTLVSWPTTLVQFLGATLESPRDALVLTLAGCLLQEGTEYLQRFEAKTNISGSSFLFNVLGGYNLHRYLYYLSFNRDKPHWFTRFAAVANIGVDLTALLVETFYLKAEPGGLIAHDIHILGIVFGMLYGVLSKSVIDKR
jgi:hypothetical protein